MFFIPTQRTSTMNSSHVYPQTKTPGASSTHLGFYEVHHHLDEDLHLSEDMPQDADSAPVNKYTFGMQPNAKVLFQFFDGWSLVQS